MKKTDLYLKPGTYIRSSVTQGDVQGISLENFVVSVLNNPTCCAKPVFIKNGMLMTTNYLSGSLQSVLDQGSNTSPLQLSTQLVRIESNLEVAERLKIESDSTVTTQTSSVVQASTTNASLVLAPNGTGAIIAQIPDGTATGGNARGNYSVDLQMERSAANKVASATYTTIGGGKSNLVSGSQGTVSGGAFNTVTSNSGVICGGSENTNNSSGGVIVGGQYNSTGTLSPGTFIGGGNSNTNSSSYGVISGGQSNTASTGTHATVVGGQSNTSSGYSSVTGGASNTNSAYAGVCFGSGNANSGNRSFVNGSGSISSGSRSFANGEGVTASGNYSVAFGIGGQATGANSFVSGNYVHAQGTNSFVNGEFGLANLYTQNTIASGRFSLTGDAQQSLLTARRESSLNSAATTILSLDGTGTTNLIIPNGTNRMWKVKVEWIATVTTITGTATGITVGDMAYGEANFGFKKVSGTSVLGNFINDEEASDSAIMDTCSLGYSVGASQELALTFTGPTFAGGGSVNMRVVAKVSLVEVAY